MYIVTWSGGTALVEDDGEPLEASGAQQRALSDVLGLDVRKQHPGGELGRGEALEVLRPGDPGHVEAALQLLDNGDALVTHVPSGRATDAAVG